MTKHIIFFVLSVCLATSIKSQSLTRTHLGSAGTSSSTSQLEVNYSVGELRVASVSANGLVITEGFQQGYYSTIDTGDGGGETTILESKSTFRFSAHPNPTTQTITVMGEDITEALELHCFSSLGQFVSSKTMIEGEPVEFDVSNLAAGYYTIEVRDEANQVINHLKFQKL